MWAGAGCELCNQAGYKGRSGIHEFLLLNRSIKDLIMAKSSSDDIKRAAIQSGMRTLRESGWDKVVKGMTAIDEILRVTQVAADEENVA